MTTPSLWKFQLSFLHFFNCLVFQSHPPPRNSNPFCVEGGGEYGYFLELHNSFTKVDMGDGANSTHYKYVWIFENGVKELNSRLKWVFFLARNYPQRSFFSFSTCLSSYHCRPFAIFLLLHSLKAALKSSGITVKCGCYNSNSFALFS